MPRAPLRRCLPNRNGRASSNLRFIQNPSGSPAQAGLTKRRTNKPVGPRPTDSDEGDRLVGKGNGRRGRYALTPEIYTSGALGAGDRPGGNPTKAQRRKSLTDAMTETLANGQKNMHKEKENGPTRVRTAQQYPEEESRDKSLHMNEIVDKPPMARKDARPPSHPLSSAVNPPESMMKSSVQPTPARDNSIFGTLKPRRRQPSILQNLDQDSTSFDIEDEEEFLPDDGATPFKDSNPKYLASTTCHRFSSLLPSSRKRKFGVPDALDPAEARKLRKPTTSPSSELGTTPEPSLPSKASVPCDKGQKHSDSISSDDDVMVLPASSPSAPSSSARIKHPAPSARRRKQTKKSIPAMTTKELLHAAMASKRQRTIRERTRTYGEFDFPADPDSDDPVEEDESRFVRPEKGRKPRRKEPLSTPSTARTKAKAKTNPGKAIMSSHASGKAAGKAKSSTSHKSSAAAPVVTPSTSSSSHETTSSSQQRSTAKMSPNSNLEMVEEDKSKPYGGSCLSRRVSDKENWADGAPSDVERAQDIGKPAPSTKDKWADVDAWDMDFEDVEVVSNSGGSSPIRT